MIKQLSRLSLVVCAFLLGSTASIVTASPNYSLLKSTKNNNTLTAMMWDTLLDGLSAHNSQLINALNAIRAALLKLQSTPAQNTGIDQKFTQLELKLAQVDQKISKFDQNLQDFLNFDPSHHLLSGIATTIAFSPILSGNGDKKIATMTACEGSNCKDYLVKVYDAGLSPFSYKVAGGRGGAVAVFRDPNDSYRSQVFLCKGTSCTVRSYPSSITALEVFAGAMGTILHNPPNNLLACYGTECNTYPLYSSFLLSEHLSGPSGIVLLDNIHNRLVACKGSVCKKYSYSSHLGNTMRIDGLYIVGYDSDNTISWRCLGAECQGNSVPGNNFKAI